MKNIQELFEQAKSLYQNGNLDRAIEVYKTIPNSQEEIYACAQFNLGVIYDDQGKLDEAIDAYKTVPECQEATYADAQFNLGIIYLKQRNIDKAIEAYKAVPQTQEVRYADAQFSLGTVYLEQGNKEEAIKAFKMVPKSQVIYAKAQFNLGTIYLEKGELRKAIEAYKAVPQNQKEVYAKAQFNLSVIYCQENELEEAIVAYQNVPTDQEEPYANAQLNLGMVYYQKNRLKDAIETFSKVSEKQMRFYLKAQLFIKIVNSKNDKNLFNIYVCREEILRKLQVTTQNLNGVEDNIAHYTRRQTAFFLLKENKENKVYPFRLSSINGVNDPTEGEVLYKWLNFDVENNERSSIFISCFTFNHDSLNQFRLYGKEENEEATGVSLVFRGEDFFEQYFDSSLGITTSYPQKTINDESSDNKEKQDKISKLPLYRCIYLDLKSDYISLASREEITFYREENPKLDVNEYMNSLNLLKDKIIKILNDIKEITSNITDIEDKNIVSEILLPLRYLVKHSAFKEEQEARIFYITSLFDPKIKIGDDNKSMYVEYEPSVKSAIHRMYLSPGAEPYKDSFRLCINDKEGTKVKVSCNPFRNKKY